MLFSPPPLFQSKLLPRKPACPSCYQPFTLASVNRGQHSRPFSAKTILPTQVNILQKSLPDSLVNDSPLPSRVSLYHMKLVPCWLHNFLATAFLLCILSIANTEVVFCAWSLYSTDSSRPPSAPHIT